jgi:hypothetical protein
MTYFVKYDLMILAKKKVQGTKSLVVMEWFQNFQNEENAISFLCFKYKWTI